MTDEKLIELARDEGVILTATKIAVEVYGYDEERFEAIKEISSELAKNSVISEMNRRRAFFRAANILDNGGAA